MVYPKANDICENIFMSENNNQQINIELDEATAQGVYSNLAVITHSQAEFVVDFIRVMPGMPKAKVQSRIIITPQHAKRLLKALNENIHKYESLHGKIQESPQADQMLNMHFGGPQGMA